MPLKHNIDDFRRELERVRERIPDEVLRPLAKRIGVMFGASATDEHMRDIGFNVAGDRPGIGRNTTSTLRIVSGRLARAVTGSPYQGRREGRTEVSIDAKGLQWSRIIDVPYAAIHEFGGTIPITERMRRFCWAMFFETEDVKWKYMAITKQTSFRIQARPYAEPALMDITPDIRNAAEEMLYKLTLTVVQ